MLAHDAAVDRAVEVAFDADEAIVARDDVDAAPDAAPDADRRRGGHVAHGALIHAHPIDQRARGADLHAGAALDAGAFAQRHAHIGDEHIVRAALFDGEREVAHEFTAGAHAAAAQNAAAVVEHVIGVRGVHREDRPIGLDGPVGHVFVVGGVLQFAIAAADLTERTEVIPFAEQHGQHELARFAQRGRVGAHHHVVAGGQRTRRLHRAETIDLHHAQAAVCHTASTPDGGTAAECGRRSCRRLPEPSCLPAPRPSDHQSLM